MTDLARWALWLEGQMTNRPGRKITLPSAAIEELIRDLRTVDRSTASEQRTNEGV